MVKNYVSLHTHDFYSNPSMIEVIDSPERYYQRASELGMKTIAISNHGNTLGWYNRYKMAEKYNMKYIHASELYVTETLDEKKKDNWHLIAIAKNYEGFKELNKLTSIASQRDNHYYYSPRISLDELFNTSDNIIVTSACLGGILHKTYKLEDKTLFNKIFDWFVKNKHRAYLEVQPHRDETQIEWNKTLKELSKEYGVRLVGAGDFHAVSKESDETRMILKKSKKIQFEGEDSFSLYMKSYDEMFDAFMSQGIWKKEEVEEFLEQTNIIADEIKEFEIDKSIKYPKLYDNGFEKLKELIAKGIKYRGIDKLPQEERKKYADRIKYELETIKKLDCADYLLLEDMVKSYARDNNIKYGSARGSASGSVITYLTRITNIDPLKEDLIFERFLNPERVGIADIDTDFPVEKRHIIQDYLLNHEMLDSAHIIAFGTLQLKGAIRDIGRGLEMPLSEVNDICDGVEENEHYYRDKYPELFKHVDRVIGCIVSISVHPCGILVADKTRNLNEEIGTFVVINKDTGEPVRATAIDMKEIDEQQWTKLDILALDGISVVANTCELAGIDYDSVMPDNIDTSDWKVWESIKEDSVNIFQFEGDFASQLYKDLFSDETIARLKKVNPNLKYTDLFSLANAILRPSCASFRDSVVNGDFYDNGLEALNEFLKETQGRLVYQEQQMDFLAEFCGYTRGHSDLVRKGIAKKKPEILEVEVPKIKESFTKTINERYGLSIEEAKNIAEPFIQVFIDASRYSFSRNHSVPYSYLGYTMAWLRYYYPLEFITASLNSAIGKEEKTNRLLNYAKQRGITIKPIKFRYSKSGYMMDKETNSIYQGVYPVKYLNESVAENLYKLKDNHYDSFVDLLVDIKDNGMLDYLNNYTIDELKELDKDKEYQHHLSGKSLGVNSRQMNILISLKFFDEFGGNRKLLRIYEEFDKKYKSTLKLKSKKERYDYLKQFEKDYIGDENLSLVEQCEAELEYLGHIETMNEETAKNIMMITEVNAMKTYTRAKAYQFATGKTREFKIGSKTYAQAKFKEKDVIQIVNAEVKHKNKKVDGVWVKSKTEKEAWLKEYKFIRKA